MINEWQLALGLGIKEETGNGVDFGKLENKHTLPKRARQ